MMIDDISFEIEGFNQPTFFINCYEEPIGEGYSPLDLPTVFFVNDETWFHKETYAPMDEYDFEI